MYLEDLGYNNELEEYRNKEGYDSFDVGRVVLGHRNSYVVRTDSEDFDCELIGSIRYKANNNNNELPCVGDWVAVSEYDKRKALIHAVFPRYSVLERKAVGVLGQAQIIAVNIDVGIIVQSANRDFNINRLERYMTICNSSNIRPIIVLSKIDLVEQNELVKLKLEIEQRIRNVPIISLSNIHEVGIDEIKSNLSKGKTFCLLGSSGVGKSTLINKLTGENVMKTGEISEVNDRGKHITTHRELITTEFGNLIDNPGMREIGLTDSNTGLEITFDVISNLSQLCIFNNCSHKNETGCAVLEGLDSGELNSESYDNYLKIEKERMHYESNAIERKRKDKNLGKLIKNMKRNNNKY